MWVSVYGVGVGWLGGFWWIGALIFLLFFIVTIGIVIVTKDKEIWLPHNFMILWNWYEKKFSHIKLCFALILSFTIIIERREYSNAMM